MTDKTIAGLGAITPTLSTLLEAELAALGGGGKITVGALRAIFNPRARYLAANRYWTPAEGVAINGGSLGTGVLRAMPFVVPRRMTIDELGFLGHTSNGAVSVKGAIYADAILSGLHRPNGAPLAEMASTTAQNTNPRSTIVGSLTPTLEPEVLYWSVESRDGAITMLGNSNQVPILIGGSTSVEVQSAAVAGHFFTTPHTYASALPTLSGSDVWTTVTGVGAAPPYFRVTALPAS